MADFFLKEKKGKTRYGWKAGNLYPFQPRFSPTGRMWPDSEKSLISCDVIVQLSCWRQNNNQNSKTDLTEESGITIYKLLLTARGTFPTTIASISLALYWKTQAQGRRWYHRFQLCDEGNYREERSVWRCPNSSRAIIEANWSPLPKWWMSQDSGTVLGFKPLLHS